VGKLADLVILDGNPLAVAEDKILEVKVIETLKEGKSVYRARRDARAGVRLGRRTAPDPRRGYRTRSDHSSDAAAGVRHRRLQSGHRTASVCLRFLRLFSFLAGRCSVWFGFALGRHSADHALE